MIQDITYETAFLYITVPTGSTTDPIAAYSYDGDNYDFDTSGTGGGENSVVFIN
jgi:hypothetical protein